MLESSAFLLHAGKGESIPREREAQFAATTRDTAALLTQIDEGCESLLRLAHSYTTADLAMARDFRGRRLPGAWFLLHVCEHMMEHWGQIQITRDLYATGRR